MGVAIHNARASSLAAAGILATSLLLVAAAVVAGASPKAAAGVAVCAAVLAVVRPTYLGWPQLLGILILIIIFIPIRRYALPGNLPFEIEPYRVFVVLLVGGWFASLLVDPRVRIRPTGFEWPLLVIVASAIGSVIANPTAVSQAAGVVDKKLMFFMSFVLVLYVTASVIRRLDNVDYLAKVLVGGGAVLAFSAMVESRTGFNIFNHLEKFIPLLQPGALADSEAFLKFGSAKLRVFGSAQHPIALGAALVVLTPLAVYLARRYKQRRWYVCATLLVAGCAATVSRTGILMLVVVALVFVWLRPREMKRLWPLIIPMLIVIKIALPGTLGAIKQSFLPTSGLIAEQSNPDGSGSGRLADIGPSLKQWRVQPLVGQGYGTRNVDGSGGGPVAQILDNQWLTSLLETGALGLFGWLWLFVRAVRRFGSEARHDDSDRGWLLVSLAAAVAAFAVGMFTYDAFSFIQVTFLLFIYLGLGSALLAERPTPLAARTRRERQRAHTEPAPAAS